MTIVLFDHSSSFSGRVFYLTFLFTCLLLLAILLLLVGFTAFVLLYLCGVKLGQILMILDIIDFDIVITMI